MSRRKPPPAVPPPPPLTTAREALSRLLTTLERHLSTMLAGGPPPEPELWARLYGEKESLSGVAVKLAQCLMRLEEGEAAPPPPSEAEAAADLALLERYLARQKARNPAAAQAESKPS